MISYFKRLPWLSLILLLAAYINFGWMLADADFPWWVWLLGTVLALAIAEALASPWSLIRSAILPWFGSDTIAFVSAMAMAFFAVVLLSWIDIAAHGVILIAAGAMLRLEAQIAKLYGLQAFLLLAGVSLCGLGLGWVLHLYCC